MFVKFLAMDSYSEVEGIEHGINQSDGVTTLSGAIALVY